MLRYEAVSPRLVVRNLMETVKFYLDVLGFDDWSGWPEGGPTFAIVVSGQTSLQFQQTQGTVSPAAETTTLHFTVASADAVLDRIAGKAAVEWGPEVYSYGRREFAIRDCNGVLLIFSEATSAPPTCSDG